MDKAITREDVIVVDTIERNTYGDLLWTDKGGENYKVSNKRVKYFEKIILPGKAVKQSYAVSTSGTEYVYQATAVEGELPPSKEPGELLPEHRDEINKATTSVVAPQELGMWWKEMGNRIGDGSLNLDFPKSATHIKTQYYKQMAKITGVTFKED